MIHSCPHCGSSSYQAGEIKNPLCPNPKCQKFKSDPVLQEGEMEMYVRKDLDPERLRATYRKRAFKSGDKLRVKLFASIWGESRHYAHIPIQEARELLEFPIEANKQLAEWTPEYHIHVDPGSAEEDFTGITIVKVKTPADGPNKNNDNFSPAVRKEIEEWAKNPQPKFEIIDPSWVKNPQLDVYSTMELPCKDCQGRKKAELFDKLIQKITDRAKLHWSEGRKGTGYELDYLVDWAMKAKKGIECRSPIGLTLADIKEELRECGYNKDQDMIGAKNVKELVERYGVPASMLSVPAFKPVSRKTSIDKIKEQKFIPDTPLPKFEATQERIAPGVPVQEISPFYYDYRYQNPKFEFDPARQKTTSGVTLETLKRLGIREADHCSGLNGKYKVVRPSELGWLGNTVVLGYRGNITNSSDKGGPQFDIYVFDIDNRTVVREIWHIDEIFGLLNYLERVEDNE